jgi:hypothetical protein
MLVHVPGIDLENGGHITGKGLHPADDVSPEGVDLVVAQPVCRHDVGQSGKDRCRKRVEIRETVQLRKGGEEPTKIALPQSFHGVVTRVSGDS